MILPEMVSGHTATVRHAYIEFNTFAKFGSPGPVCYRDSSTSKYSGQECMPGYALKEKFKRGGYQTYWGCGRNYYRKQHQRRYVSGNSCESICIKTDKCGELK